MFCVYVILEVASVCSAARILPRGYWLCVLFTCATKDTSSSSGDDNEKALRLHCADTYDVIHESLLSLLEPQTRQLTVQRISVFRYLRRFDLEVEAQ